MSRNRCLANAAWRELESRGAESYSADFERGFKTGYADYLYAGGAAETPLLPPSHFLKCQYETPQGQQAMDDWVAGFKLGATVARDSGQREKVLLRPTAPGPYELPPRLPVAPLPGSVLEVVRPTETPPETLPPPKKTDIEPAPQP